MIGLVRKRHEGDGWIVFPELANSTGGNVKGFADAVAFGIWPSRSYELHGYEFKISREDLKKELRDPQKADNIGKFCHRWNLCVSDEKLLDGLVIPETWGILVVQKRGSSEVFREVRKAPKLDAQPMTPGLCASMLRNYGKKFVRKELHETVREELHQLKNQNRSGLENAHEQAKGRIKELEALIESFRTESGIDISNKWRHGDIGKAVEAHLAMAGDQAGFRKVQSAISQHTSHKEAADDAIKHARAFYEAYGLDRHAPFCARERAMKSGLVERLRRNDPNFACDCGHDLFAKETETDALRDSHAQAGRSADHRTTNHGPEVCNDLES